MQPHNRGLFSYLLLLLHLRLRYLPRYLTFPPLFQNAVSCSFPPTAWLFRHVSTNSLGKSDTSSNTSHARHHVQTYPSRSRIHLTLTIHFVNTQLPAQLHIVNVIWQEFPSALKLVFNLRVSSMMPKKIAIILKTTTAPPAIIKSFRNLHNPTGPSYAALSGRLGS